MAERTPKIDGLLQFVDLTQQFQKIQRVVLIKDEERWESDAEHSHQLALIAWYIIDQEKLAFDLHKVLAFSLVHDLVEVHAGDTYIFTSEDHRESKKEREEKAIKRIEEEFPTFTSLTNLIHEYEERDCDEARFVYALDKLLPVMNIFLDGNGRLFKRKDVTYEMVRESKDEKIAISPEVEKYWKEFVEILEANKSEVFAE